FLRLLKLDQPDLAGVKAALDAGDVDAASAAYAAHFRAKALTSPLLPDWANRTRDPNYDTSSADALLAGHLRDGYSVYDLPPEGLDWHDSPLSCVTRFPIFSTLRASIHNSQDPQYARWTVDHILDYMRAYPIEEFAGKRTTEGWVSHTVVAKPWYWCMIPNRLRELPQTLALLRLRPGITDDELLSILQRIYEETAYMRLEIQAWVDRRHNGGGAMVEAMACSCAVLEDFQQADEWLAFDAGLVGQYLDEAFYPDGMCVELTTAYSASVSSMGQRMAYALREQDAIQERKDKLAAMITSMVAMGSPTGMLPSFGDLYASELSRYINAPLAEWLDMPWAPAAVKHDEPEPPFLNWPVDGQDQWSGYFTMRSGWDEDARFMAIDGGPWGTTHQHGDKLSFSLTALGERFIIDPSGTKYASNTEDAFIGGQPSGFLHNTITVDGVDEYHSEGTVAESTEPISNRWESGDGHTLFVSDYSFAPVKPITWERRVLFVDGAFWLLQDVLTGDQPAATVEQNFQFEKDTEVALQGNVVVATAPGGARLMLIPLDGDLEPSITIGDKAPHTTYWPSGKPTTTLRSEDGHDQKHGRGWTGRSGPKLMPAPAVTYVGDADLPATLTLAIVPLRPGEEPPEITSEREGDVTHWTLPTSGAPLRFTTSLEGCDVEG
ncbi:MAG TPA: alginate lyase family protein, partial [Armatimonadota bacterium]|nr:alginate lyase family protein [Armatimonadota bacterium]